MNTIYSFCFFLFLLLHESQLFDNGAIYLTQFIITQNSISVLPYLSCGCVFDQVRTTRLSQDAAAAQALTDLLPSMIPICLKHLGGKEDKTKVAVLGLLQLIVELVPEGVAPYTTKLFPLIGTNLKLSTSSHSLKLDAMSFLHACLVNCAPQSVRDNLDKLLPTVLTVVGEDWYKLIAQGLYSTLA